MLPSLLWLACLAVARAQDQEVSQESSQEIKTLTGSDRKITGDDATPTAFVSDFETSTIVSGSISSMSESTGSSNATASITSPSVTSTSKPLTQLGGSRTLDTGDNSTATASDSAPRPSNTQACNNYPELCNRKYSNITEVCAHNSPFAVKRNAGSNQALGVTAQLNDGVRVLQGQTHLVNGTLHYCHTTCDLLNAGTVESYLTEVTKWVAAHPFDVLTIIFGNGDYELKGADGKTPLVTSKDFVDPIEKSGLAPYIYQPPKTQMALSDWPTLSELIISQKRVITFIDYNFDLKAVPYMLWEFHNVWETPFSPTDAKFPCTLGRPGGIDKKKQKDMLYMANHNLNVEVSIAGASLLIPNTVELNVTNGVNGSGSLGNMVEGCTEMYNRPPNFLLVDYYEAGPFNGSVFAVAAQANNVTYDRKCCGTASAAAELQRPAFKYFSLIVAITVAVLW